MCYNSNHENTHFYSTFDRGRTAPNPGGTAFVRCLCDAPLPDLESIGARGTSPGDCVPAGLRRPNRAQCDPRVQHDRALGAARRLLAPPSAAHQLLGGGAGAPQRPAASQSTQLWQRARKVDPGLGSPGQLRTRHHRYPHFRRKRAPCAQTLENQLEASQTLDHEPRSAVPAKKNARDRLIAWASQQPSWAIGFGDEVWWSRFALPQMYAWQSQDQPVRLVEQPWRKDDPDPKALACYGVLWQHGAPDDPDRSQAWLRFVTGRPVSAITTQFLEWCCERLLKEGKTNWLLIWDNASWHKSQAVRTWIRQHNQQVKQTSKGVRILPFLLPTQSPWLNPIEPRWVHAKRNVVEHDGLLTARQLAERVCAYFGCSYEPHLIIPEKLA